MEWNVPLIAVFRLPSTVLTQRKAGIAGAPAQEIAASRGLLLVWVLDGGLRLIRRLDDDGLANGRRLLGGIVLPDSALNSLCGFGRLLVRLCQFWHRSTPLGCTDHCVAVGRFLRHDPKGLENVRSESLDHRHVAGVASPGNGNAANTACVVAGIEREPAPVQITSNQALKSIGAGSGGTPMSPR